jgi:hypothetical protein
VGQYATLVCSDTILAGHSSAGLWVSTGSAAHLDATLWYSNGTHTGGGGTIITGSLNVYDDPRFVDPAAWNYHLQFGSAAIDAGIEAGVSTDIDGQVRPQRFAYDIGADEYANRPPTAAAAAPQTIHTGAIGMLDGSGSHDPENDPLTYRWTQVGGPSVNFTTDVRVTTFTAPFSAAVLTFTLAVTDTLGLPDPTPAQVVITVERYHLYLPLVIQGG